MEGIGRRDAVPMGLLRPREIRIVCAACPSQFRMMLKSDRAF